MSDDDVIDWYTRNPIAALQCEIDWAQHGYYHRDSATPWLIIPERLAAVPGARDALHYAGYCMHTMERGGDVQVFWTDERPAAATRQRP